MNINGDKSYICERICRTYIETSRTVRSLAKHYGCSKSTIHNYLTKYASDLVDYSLLQKVRNTARQNMMEVYLYGQSENRYSDQYGSMD